MNRQLTTILTLGILASMAIGCTGNKVNADGNVAVEFNNTINPLAENISSIELIPLETDSEHLVGGITDLTIAGDSYIVMDLINNNIFRYSADGKFLGRIGQKGNGPEEYIQINDIQYRDGNLCVFSTPSKLQRFSLDGNMIDSKIFPEMDLGSMSWLTDEGVLTYYGYGSGRDSRFALIADSGKKTFYPSEEKVLNYTPMSKIYSETGGKVYVIDSYSNVVKEYSAGEVSDGTAFDFGKYSIPESFFGFDDAFAAMETLMSSEYALLNQYLCDGDSRLVNILVQKGMEQDSYYGLLSGGDWHWFSAGKPGQDVFAGSFKEMKDGIIYCLLEPATISTFPSSLKKRLSNPEILNSISEEDNCVIAKLHLTK